MDFYIGIAQILLSLLAFGLIWKLTVSRIVEKSFIIGIQEIQSQLLLLCTSYNIKLANKIFIQRMNLMATWRDDPTFSVKKLLDVIEFIVESQENKYNNIPEEIRSETAKLDLTLLVRLLLLVAGKHPLVTLFFFIVSIASKVGLPLSVSQYVTTVRDYLKTPTGYESLAKNL